MIHVLEIPDQGQPHAWFAFDAADFARKVEAEDTLQPYEIHDVVTPRELLALTGYQVGDADAAQQFPAICSLGDEHGWDTPLYRADYLTGRGHYRPEPIHEAEAYAAALLRREPATLIFWDDAQAVLAIESPQSPLLQQTRWRARHALHEQLVALELLADGGH